MMVTRSMVAMPEPSAPLSLRHRLAQNLRRLRLERQWSQEDLAERSGLHHNQISMIERARSSVGIDIVEKLMTALGVRASDLLD